MRMRWLVAGVVLASAAPCLATETVTYTYDAQGRLVRVVRSGNVNNGQTVDYTLDSVGNRTRVVAAGASR